MIVQMRFIAKSMGFRIPKTSTSHFHKLDKSSWPKEFSDIAWPMLKNLEQLDITIKTYEKQIRELAETPAFKAQVDRLKEIHYVGLYAATGFVAVTGGDMDRFERPRDIGPWLGLSPKQNQSGDIDRQCHITKAGSPFMRRLLVECAQMILRDGSIETNLKIKGMRISSSPEVNASSTCIYFLSLLGSIDSGVFSFYSFLGRKPAFTSGLISLL
jgi:hypothetical protein